MVFEWSCNSPEGDFLWAIKLVHHLAVVWVIELGGVSMVGMTRIVVNVRDRAKCREEMGERSRTSVEPKSPTALMAKFPTSARWFRLSFELTVASRWESG